MSAAAAAANPGSPHLAPGDIESPPDAPPPAHPGRNRAAGVPF